MKKLICIILSLLILVFCFAGCKSEKEQTEPSKELSTAPVEKETGDGEHPRVKVDVENFGEFIIELYPEYAPKTVDNFLSLVRQGFYDGTIFHRVMEDFMAQGGDPTGTGNGGSGKTIKGEFAANGFEQNTLSHTRGVVSMARSPENDSASSQFFICYSDTCTYLDGQYAAFGKVVEGMDVVDEFAKVKMAVNSFGEEASPVEPITIRTMEVI